MRRARCGRKRYLRMGILSRLYDRLSDLAIFFAGGLPLSKLLTYFELRYFFVVS